MLTARDCTDYSIRVGNTGPNDQPIPEGGTLTGTDGDDLVDLAGIEDLNRIDGGTGAGRFPDAPNITVRFSHKGGVKPSTGPYPFARSNARRSSTSVWGSHLYFVSPATVPQYNSPPNRQGSRIIASRMVPPLTPIKTVEWSIRNATSELAIARCRSSVWKCSAAKRFSISSAQCQHSPRGRLPAFTLVLWINGGSVMPYSTAN